MSRKGVQPKVIEPQWPEGQVSAKVVSFDENPINTHNVQHKKTLKEINKYTNEGNMFPQINKRLAHPVSFQEPNFPDKVRSAQNFTNLKQKSGVNVLYDPQKIVDNQSTSQISEDNDSSEEENDMEEFEIENLDGVNEIDNSQVEMLQGTKRGGVVQVNTKPRNPETQKREKARKENSLEAFLGISDALGYIGKLKFDVSLSDLYTVIDSCNYNDDNFWTPVILKVGEMMQETGKTKKFQVKTKLTKFLLQVWDKKGRMVYERQLLQPVRNWGIFGDIFIFVEEGQPKKVQVVKLRKEEPATLFTVNLNMKTIDVKLVKSIEDRLDYEFASSIDHQLVAYSHGYLLYGTRKTIHYLEIDSIIQQHNQSYQQEIALDFHENSEENNISNFKIESKYIFKGFIDVGDNFAAMLMEDETDNDLSFIRIKNISENGIELSTCGIHDATRNQVASPIQDLRSVITRSKDGKYTQAAVALRENGRLDFYSDFRLVDQSLPQDTFIDIEADFKQFYIKKQKTKEEIAADSKKSPRQTEETLILPIYKCALQWKNRIGMTSKQLFKPKEDNDRWQLIVHYRVKNSLKLYSCFLCYSTYFLVSHRNMVSVFDLKTNNWQQNMEFDDFVQYLALCQSSSDKQEQSSLAQEVVRSSSKTQEVFKARKLKLSLTDNFDSLDMKDNFVTENNSLSNLSTNVAVVVGNSLINLIKENKTGNRQMLHKSRKNINIGGRALSWLDDQECNTGLYFIVDDLPNNQLIVDFKGKDAFYTYESEMNHDAGKCSIVAYTKGKIGTLLEDDDALQQCSQMTIYPGVTRESLDEVDQSPFDRVEVKTDTKLMISTFWMDLNDDGANDIQNAICKVYSVVETVKNTLELKRDQQGEIEVDNFIKVPDAEKLVGAAVVKDPSNGEKQCFTIQVTDVGINIFDRTHTLYAKYNNCNIRHILFSDDAYMYCLADAVKEPISKTDNQDNEIPFFKDCKETAGLFCYDLSRLVNEGKLDHYKLAGALVGINSNLSYSEFNQRMSFCKDFTRMQILPFAHRNTINFLGMGIRQDYLIWREKNGFFTCLSTEGVLRTWSIATGKLLYRYKNKYKPDQMCNYVIYQAAKLRNEIEDNSQLMNFYNFPDRSLSIIRKKEFETKLVGSQINISQMDTILSNLNRNRSKTIAKPDLQDTQVFAKRSSTGACVELKLAQQRVGVFNFKVLELKTIDDFEENGESENCDRVQELFNFNFPITLPNKNVEKGQEFHTLDTQQRLYLSRDTFRLMEVINNQIAQIYERTRGETKLGATVQWDLVATINQFPTVLQGNNSANFLFSPNFDRYIDIVYSQKQFAIREVEWFKDGIPRIKDKELNKKDLIPKDIISFKGYGEKDPKDIVKYIASRIAFVADHVIRVITLSGIDCLFDVKNRQYEIHPGVFNYRLLSYTKLDNYRMGTFNAENHSLLEKKPLHIDDVFVRLVRKNHVQKSWLDQYKYLLKDKSDRVLKEIKRVSRLTSVDYNLGTGGESNAFIAELSFTLLDWIILDKIQGKKPFTLRNIDGEQQLQLCFNIFPGGKTILHKLASVAEADTEGGVDEEGSYNTHQAIKDLFERAKSGLKFDCQYFDEGQSLEIPMLNDMQNKTAIDLAMGLTEPTEFDSILEDFSLKTEDSNVLEMNMEMALVLFECIKGYQTLHSSPYLVNAITEAIDHNLPGIGDYLDARVRKYEGIHISTMQTRIKKNKIDAISGEQKYGVFSIDVVGKTKRVKQGLFNTKGPKKQMIYEIFDVPQLYQDTKNGAKFVRALGNNENTELFNHVSVQKIVNYHWKGTSKYVYGFMFFPLCVQMAVFIQWHVAYIGKIEDPDYYYHNLVSKWLLVVMCAYFMIIELRQASRNWSNYFTVENIFDLIPNILLLFNCFYIKKLNETEEVYDEEIEAYKIILPYHEAFWKIQAFAALTLWFKFILFLRVFDTTSFLIHMILEVVWALIPFMIVLVLSIIGFTDAFYSLNMSYQEEYKIEGMESIRNVLFYSILNTFGEFEVENFDLTGKIFFVLASFVNLIILLNLVIAIISDIFSTVNTERLEAFYMERAQLIADVWTIFPPISHDPDAKSRLLFFATEVSVKHIRKQVQDQKKQEEEDQLSEQAAMTKAIMESTEMIKTKLDEMKGLTGQENAIVRKETLGLYDNFDRRSSVKSRPRSASDQQQDPGLEMQQLITRVEQMESQIQNVDGKLDEQFDSMTKKLRSIVKKVNQLLSSEEPQGQQFSTLVPNRNKSPL